ncbi:MAG TPA: dUTP diphosphatase [Spirochaetes bacterium]|nr:dUTP diphosphatase [Spirochaetota bacterium]
MLPIKITMSAGANLPRYQSAAAAGADIYALTEEPMVVEPGKVALVPTGLRMSIPEGYEAQIRPRSGLALKHGITLLNTPGTIDADYRGEVKIIIANLGAEPFEIRSGMRIAQMVLARVFRAEFTITECLDETGRNEGGFGHSGL